MQSNPLFPNAVSPVVALRVRVVMLVQEVAAGSVCVLQAMRTALHMCLRMCVVCTSDLLYHPLPYFFETESFTRSAPRLVGSKP